MLASADSRQNIESAKPHWREQFFSKLLEVIRDLIEYAYRTDFPAHGSRSVT